MQKAQCFVGLPIKVKAFQVTPHYLLKLDSENPQGSQEPFPIKFDGKPTGATYNPTTKQIRVPRGGVLDQELKPGRWFIYEKGGAPWYQIVATSELFFAQFEADLSLDRV